MKQGELSFTVEEMPKEKLWNIILEQGKRIEEQRGALALLNRLQKRDASKMKVSDGIKLVFRIIRTKLWKT